MSLRCFHNERTNWGGPRIGRLPAQSRVHCSGRSSGARATRLLVAQGSVWKQLYTGVTGMAVVWQQLDCSRLPLFFDGGDTVVIIFSAQSVVLSVFDHQPLKWLRISPEVKYWETQSISSFAVFLNAVHKGKELKIIITHPDVLNVQIMVPFGSDYPAHYICCSDVWEIIGPVVTTAHPTGKGPG